MFGLTVLLLCTRAEISHMESTPVVYRTQILACDLTRETPVVVAWNSDTGRDMCCTDV